MGCTSSSLAVTPDAASRNACGVSPFWPASQIVVPAQCASKGWETACPRLGVGLVFVRYQANPPPALALVLRALFGPIRPIHDPQERQHGRHKGNGGGKNGNERAEAQHDQRSAGTGVGSKRAEKQNGDRSWLLEPIPVSEPIAKQAVSGWVILVIQPSP